jgi:hypothetical protein
MCSAPATPSCPASCAAGCGGEAWRPRRPGPMPAAPSPSRACSARRNIPTWDELCLLPQERQQAPRAAQGRGDQPHPLGDDAPQATYRSDGARLRPPHPAGGRRRRSGAARRFPSSSVLAVQAAARVADGRDGYGMLIDEIHGRDAMFDAPATTSPGSAGRWNCRARGRCASSSARTSARSWSNGRSTIASSACASIIPTIRLSSRRAAGEAAHAVRGRAPVGRELLIEIIAGKHGRSRMTPCRARLEELYALGIKPDWWKLEPQASAPRGRTIERGHRPPTIPMVPRRRAAWARGAAGRAGSGLRRDG